MDPDTDGTVRIAKECTSGLKPVNIVITGDGFLEEDYATGGAFDQAANRADRRIIQRRTFQNLQCPISGYKR